MIFDPNENRLLYRSAVERFVGPFNNAVRRSDRNEPSGFSRARWKEMAELGLFQLAIAEADGGIGGDAQDCEVVAQALGYGLALEPWLECGFWPAYLLQVRANDLGVAKGDLICAVAANERGHEADWLPQATIAQRDGDAFRISGRKVLVLGGGNADHFLVTARHGDESVCLLVPRGAHGLGLHAYRIIDGSLAAELTLDDVRVPLASWVCGEEGIARATVAVMLIASAEMVGIAHRLFDETLAYVKIREQFGQPIGRFQVVQHRMVDSYVALEMARSTLFWVVQDGWDAAFGRVAGAKAFIAELARTVAHDAVQLHGGMGMTDELLIGHGLKRLRLLSKLFVDPVQGIHLFGREAVHG